MKKIWLALAGMTVADLPDGTAIGGPVGLLQQLDDQARLLFA